MSSTYSTAAKHFIGSPCCFKIKQGFAGVCCSFVDSSFLDSKDICGYFLRGCGAQSMLFSTGVPWSTAECLVLPRPGSPTSVLLTM